MGDKTEREWNELRIRGINSQTFNDVKNIARNTGVTMSELLKPEIVKIINSYPERMKSPPKKD